jgi:Mrp family chromosome partitioning ATPase/capsular polysaccharide biosynthesis protein
VASAARPAAAAELLIVRGIVLLRSPRDRQIGYCSAAIRVRSGRSLGFSLKDISATVDEPGMRSHEIIDAEYHPRPDLELTLPPEPAVYEQSDLRAFLMLLRRHALLVAVLTLATAAGTYVVTLRQSKVYDGTATLLLTPPAAATQAPTVDTIVGVGTSTAVLQPVAKRYAITVQQLRNSVSSAGSTASNSNLITISATANTPLRSAAIANSVAKSLISYLKNGEVNVLRVQIVSLEQQLQAFAGRTDPSSLAAATDLRTQIASTRAQLAALSPALSVLSPATLPSSPSSPHPTRDAAIGLLAGLVLAVMLAVLRDKLDRRIRGVDEIEAIYNAPVLGIVPFMRGRTNRAKMLADFSGTGDMPEAYRTIRTNLTLVRPNIQEVGVVVVSSAIAGEGKSAAAANLGHALAVTGNNVLLVSADLHHPSLHRYFESSGGEDREPSRAATVVDATAQAPPASRSAGLAEVLAGEVSLTDALRKIPLSERERTSGGSLSLLANSTTFFDPAVLFGSAAMQGFVARARQHYDVVIFDTPPLLSNPDAMLLARSATSLVLVARLDVLTKNQARRALRLIAATRLSVTGVIVMGNLEEPSYGYGYDGKSENEFVPAGV